MCSGMFSLNHVQVNAGVGMANAPISQHTNTGRIQEMHVAAAQKGAQTL